MSTCSTVGSYIDCDADRIPPFHIFIKVSLLSRVSLWNTCNLQLAFGKEQVTKGSTLEAVGQACFVIMHHIVVHADGIVPIDITLAHNGIHAPQNLEQTPRIPVYIHKKK
jgi:hypothetical protein